jgi:O-antigen ligase
MMRGLEIVYAILAVLVIAGTPLVMTPATYDSFILPKVVWVKLTVLLMLVTAFLRFTFGERLRFYLHRINLFLLIFFALSCVSIRVAKSVSLALESVSFLMAVTVFVFLLQDYVRGRRTRIVLIGWAVMLSALITAGWVIYEDFIRAFRPEWLRSVSKLSDWRGYLTAGLGNTNHIGDFIAFAVPIALVMYLYVRGKVREIFMLLCLGIMFAGLMICWSVGSNVGLMIAILALVFMLAKPARAGGLESRRFWKRKAVRPVCPGRLLVLLAVLGLVAAFYLTSQPLNPHRPSLWKEAFSSERWHAGLPTRLAIWANTLELIHQHPWFGVGVGNFTYAYVGANSQLLFDNPTLAPYAGLYTNAAHNEVLQTWAELGVFGLAAFAILVALFYKSLVERMRGSSKVNYLIRAVGIACMTAFLAFSMMNFTLRLPASTVLFFSLLSLPVMLKDKTRALAGTSHLMPLELRYRHASVTLYLEGLRRPREIAVEIRIAKAVQIAVAVLLLLTGLIGVEHIMKAWESDRHYKIAHVLMDAGNVKAAEKEFRHALALNQEHSDCRSAFSTFLMGQARYQEALQQLLKVNERLDSLEVHERLGEVYQKLGETSKELEQWRVFFNRRPQNRVAFRAQYRRFLALLRK